ncbi:hypothetical protein [Rubricoccus marinus]|uniref:VanZ-like domain-containing protein n=1 Tax=Rubricoccus marinus TaxID=716817 RepID=A0A259TXT8_9BACT|nr:hypothetical protein [Rubricoccus marinus]OZC02521.1 hypothetical protein BSZ36_05750 [Rubricoccus marinus]
MNVRIALALLWTLIIIAACSVPGHTIPSFNLFSEDKLYHIVAFLGFGLAWTWAGAKPRTVLWSGLALAIGTELWQSLPFIGRYADPLDALADMIGVGLSLYVARTFHRAMLERREQR